MANILSEAGTVSDKLNVFISYSRRDAVVADAVVEALEQRGFEVTIDRRDLPFGEKWQAELAEFIRLSDTVIWLISESSITSKWVNWELDEVARRNKRLVPVMAAPVTPDELPRQLGDIHILPVERVFDLARDLDMLCQVLERDQAWLKEASRLQDRAVEWLAKSRTPALLLSRGALADAERWNERRPAKAPAPAPEVMDMLLASRQAATRRQRWWIGGLSTIAVSLVGLALWAESNRYEAVARREEADQQRHLAEERRQQTETLRSQTQTTESGLLSSATTELFDKQGGDATTAMLLTLEALPDEDINKARPYVAEAEKQLSVAFQALQEEAIFPAGGYLDEAVLSPDEQKFIGIHASYNMYANPDRSKKSVDVWDIDRGVKLFSLTHKNDKIYAAFSPDQTKIITTSRNENDPSQDDNNIYIWDAIGGASVMPLKGHTAAVNTARFSPDGKFIVSASADGSVRLWDANSGQAMRLLEKGGGSEAEFCPDGRAIISRGSSVAIYDLQSRVSTDLFDNAGYGAMAIISNCKSIVFANNNDMILVRIDVTERRKIVSSTALSDTVHSVLISPDGTRTLTVASEKVQVWDMQTLTLISEFHQGPSGASAWSPDGKLVATGAFNVLRIWDPANGIERYRLSGHTSHVTSVSFFDQGRRILTTSADGTARVWRSPNQPPSNKVLVHNTNVTSVNYSVDGKYIITATGDGIAEGGEFNAAWIWDSQSGASISRLEHEGMVDSSVQCGSKRILTRATAENVATLWDLDTGAKIAQLKPNEGFEEEVNDALCALSDEWIATGERDQTVRIWDQRSGKLLKTLRGHHNQVTAVAVSTDGRALASGGGGLEYLPADNALRIWDTRRWQEIALLSGHTQPIDAITFSRDGKRLVSTSQDVTARVWELARKKELLQIPLREHCSCHVYFSPTDDRILITSSLDSLDFTKVYDSHTGSELFSLDGQHAKYSPDGTRILTIKNHALLVWDGATGKLLSNISGHTSWLTSAVFSPRLNVDGKMSIATSSADKSVRIWSLNTSTQALVNEAKSRVPRCLTQAQRAQYFLPLPPPRWCITGAALQAEPNPAKWQPKWPYHTAAWRDWLAARDRGEAPPLPADGS